MNKSLKYYKRFRTKASDYYASLSYLYLTQRHPEGYTNDYSRPRKKFHVLYSGVIKPQKYGFGYHLEAWGSMAESGFWTLRTLGHNESGKVYLFSPERRANKTKGSN